MARIAGVDLPEDKRIDFSLTRIYGIGWSLSERILAETRIDPKKNVGSLEEDEVSRLARAVEQYVTEGDLRRSVRQHIQRLSSIGSYRGIRHSRGLPVRGQRTRTNARTKRGKRQTVGAFKKEVLAKMGKGEGKSEAEEAANGAK